MKKDKLRRGSHWLFREWIRPVLPVLILLTAVRSAVADWNDVPTGSMNPSILEGDRVFVNKLAYSLRFPLTRWHLAGFASPQRGDIVVFISAHDGKRLVKRVVGVAGDEIEMQNNRLVLNGAPLSYDFASDTERTERAPTMPDAWPVAIEQLPGRPHPVIGKPGVPALRSFPETRVPDGHVFVMGDSRDDSFDSRYFGPVDCRRILGQATHVVLSFDPNHHHRPRWSRFFDRLP
jgi:signal peptidase I